MIFCIITCCCRVHCLGGCGVGGVGYVNVMIQAFVKSMNIIEGEFELQYFWSDFNASFVGISDETKGTVKKLIDFFPPSFDLKAKFAKQALVDLSKKLSKAHVNEKKMEVAHDEDILVSEINHKKEKCRAMAKRKPNMDAMRTPLKQSPS